MPLSWLACLGFNDTVDVHVDVYVNVHVDVHVGVHVVHVRDATLLFWKGSSIRELKTSLRRKQIWRKIKLLNTVG